MATVTPTIWSLDDRGDGRLDLVLPSSLSNSLLVGTSANGLSFGYQTSGESYGLLNPATVAGESVTSFQVNGFDEFFINPVSGNKIANASSILVQMPGYADFTVPWVESASLYKGKTDGLTARFSALADTTVDVNATPVTQRNVWWEITHEEIQGDSLYTAGYKQSANSVEADGSPKPNGYQMANLPEPQNSVTQAYSGGGYTNGAGADMPIVTSYEIKQNNGETNYPGALPGSGEIVTPRAGTHFQVMRVDKRKRYDNHLNDVTAGDQPEQWKDKPRCAAVSVDSRHRVDAWADVYWGHFSIYIPLNYENDTGENYYNGRIIQLQEFGHSPGENHFVWHIGAINKSDTGSSMVLRLSHNPNGDTYANQEYINFGFVDQYKGQWLDVTVRLRANPFDQATTVNSGDYSYAVAGSYPGNDGILEVFMNPGGVPRKVFSRINAPVGNAPSSRDGGTMTANHRIYKYNYKYVGSESDWRPSNSTVVGPEICLPRDEIRIGKESLGQGFSDVHPDQAAEPTNVPIEGVDYEIVSAPTVLEQRMNQWDGEL